MNAKCEISFDRDALLRLIDKNVCFRQQTPGTIIREKVSDVTLDRNKPTHSLKLWAR